MSERTSPLTSLLEETFDGLQRTLREHRPGFRARESGLVRSVGRGIAQVSGLPGVWDQEVVRFSGGALGMVFNLDADRVGVILLDHGGSLSAGDEVRRTGRVLDVPVGDALLGRVVDTLGRPLDDQGPVQTGQRREVDTDAAPIMHRAPVNEPLQTGIKVVDALLPIGRGQRELIVGDRQTGKTSLAMDTILNQRDTGVVCVYCFIGQPASAVARFVEELRARDAMRYTIVMSADGEDPPALQYLAPYAATSMAEHFMENGRDALIVYDDLTRHAWAYRELSLLLRRPPGREAFPGDIFYIHARLLERSTHLREEHGGGSLTALPIVETEAQNLSAYIPTNIISITDGQIYLSPTLFQRGMLPAVEVGRSVSRVGGKAQAPAYRAVAGDLRLSYSQFEELESFARFGARLDEDTRRTLEHGRRVREILKQPQYEPMPMEEQIAVLLAVSEGAMEGVPIDGISAAESAVREAVRRDLTDVAQRIRAGEKLTDDDRAALLDSAREAIAPTGGESDDAGA